MCETQKIRCVSQRWKIIEALPQVRREWLVSSAAAGAARYTQVYGSRSGCQYHLLNQLLRLCDLQIQSDSGNLLLVAIEFVVNWENFESSFSHSR